MASNVEPIRNEADYDAAMEEVAALWGAASGTPQGARLDVLATLIDAYEAAHDAMDAPVPRPSGGKVREHRQPPQDKGPHPILTNPPRRGASPIRRRRGQRLRRRRPSIHRRRLGSGR